MKYKQILLLTSLALTTTILTSCNQSITGDNIVKKTDGHFTVQGSVKVKKTNINSKTAGEVTEVKISEGNSIKNGQVLITIDNTSLQARAVQKQGQIETAIGQKHIEEGKKQEEEAVLQLKKNGKREEEIAKLKSELDLAQATYNRVKTLHDKNYASDEDFDRAATQLEVYKQKYELGKNETRAEDIETAEAKVKKADSAIQSCEGKIKEAEGNFNEIKTYIDDTTIVAPADGLVTELNVKAGELVSTGLPLLIMTNTDAPWVECYVREQDVSKVKLNEEVSIKLSAYPNKKFKGKVVRINEKPDFAVKRPTNDNGQFDVLSYGVKVEFENAYKNIHSGMTAIVDFGK